MSDIKTYEDIQRGKPVHSDGVMAHIGIVKRVASHLRGRLPEYMDLDELVQVGMIGLIEATKTFDDSKGVDFELFAKNVVEAIVYLILHGFFREFQKFAYSETLSQI